MKFSSNFLLGDTIKKKILLTGARSLFTLDLARRFHEQGHTVYVAETTHYHVCRFSNAVAKHFTIPSPRFKSEEFINTLVQIVQTEKIDLLIPSFEEIFCLSKGLHRFPKSCKVCCSSYQTLDALHNKWRFNQKIKDLGFASPKSVLIKSQKDLDTISLAPPYILKPCYSRAAQQILKVSTTKPPKLDIDPNNPFVAQEWLEGKKYCSYSIAHEGKLTAHTAYPVDCSLDGNACLNFEAINHPQIHEWIKTFVEKENFTGQIAFDFIQTEDETLYAIECNPRGTSGIHLFKKKENLPEAFFHPNLPLLTPSLGSSKQILWGMILYGWKSSYSQKKTLHYLKKLLTVPDIIFSFKDLRPFFFQPALFLVYIFKSLRLKTCIPSMFTFDIDWNGEALTDLEQIPCNSSE